MSGPSFTFPPPPPAPPQASQSCSAHLQPQQGPHGYGTGHDRGGRFNPGYGRPSNRGGSRGGHFGLSHSTPGYGGYSAGSHQQWGPQNSDHGTQQNGQKQYGHRPPNYPPVQLPQYPLNLRQDYVPQPSNIHTGNHRPQTFQNGYPLQEQQAARQDNYGYQSSSSHGYNSTVHGMQSAVQGTVEMGPLPHNFNGPTNQPTSMSPVYRMGFEGDRQNRQTHFLPRPTAAGNILFPDGPSHDDGSTYQQNSFSSFHNGLSNTSNQYPGQRGRGHKRGHGEAFGRPRNQNPRPQAAPAVPSFGGALPLPVKPPLPQDHGRRLRKKKRKHNQLGLTPKTEEHESSEADEDDADEESRLASNIAGSGSGSQLLQFDYRGQTSTLSSSSDITAWIDERKKRYPTKARVDEAAERKRQLDEMQKIAIKARKEPQQKQRTEAKERQRLKGEAEQKRKKAKEYTEDAASNAKRKVERLRKKLRKEEKRVAKAEAEASKTSVQARGEAKDDRAVKRKRSDSGDFSSLKVADAGMVKSEDHKEASVDGADLKSEPGFQVTKGSSAVAGIYDVCPHDGNQESRGAVQAPPDPLTPMSQPSAPDGLLDDKALGLNSKPDLKEAEQPTSQTPSKLDEVHNASVDRAIQDSTISMTDSSSDTLDTDSEDFTSSSGSSSSASNSSDDAPRQASSKQSRPEKVAPRKRQKPKQICRDFLNSGRCKRADKCRYRHQLPERGSRAAHKKEDKRSLGRGERVTLHQRLVEQEKEKEDHIVLKAIIHLGQKGLLDREMSDRTAEG